MTSRIVITAVIATGALASSAGAALAASALSTDTNASAAQYGSPSPQSTTLGGGSEGNPSGPSGGGAGGGGPSGGGVAGGGGPSAGGVAGAGTQAPAASQAPRQLEAQSAGRLPFTGYAAIPLLLIGLALLSGGVVLRRSTHGHAAG